MIVPFHLVRVESSAIIRHQITIIQSITHSAVSDAFLAFFEFFQQSEFSRDLYSSNIAITWASLHP